MALWQGNGLPGHPRRRELLFAIREHDNGWREEDAVPRLDADSGRPLAFDNVSARTRIEIWRRGVRRFSDLDHPGQTRSERAFIALLILRHALEIHGDYWESPDWQDFRGELVELEAQMLEDLESTPSAIERDYVFLELADTLSLGACGALGSEPTCGTLHDYRFEVELGRIRLSPFPFVGATTVQVAYRALPLASFETSPELANALAAAPWARLPVHLEPYGFTSSGATADTSP